MIGPGAKVDLDFVVPHRRENRRKPLFHEGTLQGYEMEGEPPASGRFTNYISMELKVEFRSILDTVVRQEFTILFVDGKSSLISPRALTIDPQLPDVEPFRTNPPVRG